MSEKYILREAVRDVITDTVYMRQKHPFLSPPATLSPDETFSHYVQDTLRGSALKSLPFFNQKAVVDLLDRLPSMESAPAPPTIKSSCSWSACAFSSSAWGYQHSPRRILGSSTLTNNWVPHSRASFSARVGPYSFRSQLKSALFSRI